MPKNNSPRGGNTRRPTGGFVTVPHLIRVAEAAAIACTTKSSIIRAYRAGQIRIFRSPEGGIVRIHADSLVNWLERNSSGEQAL